MYPYNFKRGQLIQTHVDGVSCDRSFLAHFQVTPLAAAVAAVLAQTNLTALAQSISVGITDPDVVRNLKIVANVAGVVGNVVAHCKNYKDEDVDVTITANGVTEVEGVVAIKKVETIDLPAQTHTPAQQTETKEVTHAVDSNGNITLDFTAVALAGASPYDLVVAVTTALDDVTKTAAAIVEAINEDETLSAVFTASNEAGVITLTANDPAANDATLAIGFTDTGTTGVTMGASTNGTAGVPYDKISVGYGDILGLPFLLSHNTVLKTYLDNVLEGTTPAVVADDDEIEKNTIDLNSALNGDVVDVYLLV